VKSAPILLLCSDSDSSRIVYNTLVKRYPNITVVVEEKIPRTTFLRNRIRKVGLRNVVSQVAFMVIMQPLLKWRSARRVRQIISANGLDVTRIPLSSIDRVSSINDVKTIDIIERTKPGVIVVNGTRIISKKVLSATSAPFINTHTGITPDYRGAHGGYWAFYNCEQEKAGVTVHLVDSGIDTGDVIGQTRIAPTEQDCFITYPYLQTVAALPLLSGAVDAVLLGTLEVKKVGGNSAVWYHPGVFQYLLGWWLRGVK